jgi:hypothetical protein
MSCIRVGMHDDPDGPGDVAAQYKPSTGLSVPLVGTVRRD